MRISDWSSDVCSSDLKAEALDPRSAQTQSMLGLLYERIGRPALAEPYYEKSAKLAPRDGATLNNYAIWLCRSKRSEERSEEHTSELQSLMRISYAVFCLQKKNRTGHAWTVHHAP